MKKPIITFIVLIIIVGLFLLYKHKSSEFLKIGFVTDLEYNQSDPSAGLIRDSLLKAVSSYNYILKPDLVIGGGDYIDNQGSKDEFLKNFNEIIAVFEKIKTDKIYCLGKKDYNPEFLEEIKNNLNLKQTYNSNLVKGFRILTLDTTENDKEETTLGTISQEQLDWLEKEFSESEPVLIFSHHSLIEIPAGDTWQKNLTNQTELYKILKENRQKIVAVFSGNSQNDYITKKSGVPFLNIGGLGNFSTLGRFSEIKISRNHKNPNFITIDLVNHGKNGSKYQIERNLEVSTDTRVNLVKKEFDYLSQKWFDLNDSNFPQGIVSAKAGKEAHLNITKNGNVVVAYESEANDDKIQVKIYKNGQWLNLEDENYPDGLISLGDSGNPIIETRDEDVFVVFTEKDYGKRNRLLWWQNDNQKWVEISDKGFISDKPSHESTLIFDKNKENLFVVFAEQIDPNQEQTQIKVKKWNGERWEDLPTSFSFFARNWNSSLDEIALISSTKDKSIYIAYQEITSDGRNLVQVKKWDGGQWKNLNNSPLYLDKISKINGFSPSLAIDKNENLYLSFVENNQDRIHVYQYNQQSSWVDVSPANQTETAIEPSIAINNNNALYLAYSEYKENVVMFKEAEDDFIKTGAWRVRVKKFENDRWSDCEDDFSLNGYISKGSGKGDPALTIFQDSLFVIFGDEENDYKARVRKYSE